MRLSPMCPKYIQPGVNQHMLRVAPIPAQSGSVEPRYISDRWISSNNSSRTSSKSFGKPTADRLTLPPSPHPSRHLQQRRNRSVGRTLGQTFPGSGTRAHRIEDKGRNLHCLVESCPCPSTRTTEVVPGLCVVRPSFDSSKPGRIVENSKSIKQKRPSDCR